MPKEKNQLAIDLSKISPNLLIILIVGISFLAGFLFGRSTSSKNSVSQVNTKKEQAPEESAPAKKLSEIIKELGVDEEKFKTCLSSEKYKSKVDEQFNEGAKAGIQGTPGGVLMDLKTGKKINLSGAVPYDTLVQILNDLKAGKDDSSAPSVAKPDSNKDHWRGPTNARYVLIEYSDFECPFCDRFHPIAAEFLEKNKDVAWVYRHFPLRQIHPNAQKLAEASECVYEQKGDVGFWEYADKVFEAMPNLEIDY